MASVERQIQTDIMDYLKSKGFIMLKFNNGTHSAHGSKIATKKSSRGVADLLGVSPDGRFTAVETKRPGGKPTIAQIAFVEEVKKRGGIGLITDNLEDVKKIL